MYSVSRLNNEARSVLERNFPPLWIEGELSIWLNLASGHLYFSLKDESSQVRCAMFRTRNRNLDFIPEDGMHVLLHAEVSLYAERGDFQLIVQYMEEAGAGALRRAFDALKHRLSAEDVGCPFYSRCPLAIDTVCDKQPAPVRTFADEHRIACHQAPDALEE